MRIGAAPPALLAEYPPANPDLRDSIADIADFVHVEEEPSGRIMLYAEREPPGHVSYGVRLYCPNRVVAWNRLGGLRQLMRGQMERVEKADGIERRF